MSDNDIDDEDDPCISLSDQKNVNKFLFIPQNPTDFFFGTLPIQIRDISELKQIMDQKEYATETQLKDAVLGKTHAVYFNGLYFNNQAMHLLKKEEHEDGIIFGNVILFSKILK